MAKRIQSAQLIIFSGGRQLSIYMFDFSSTRMWGTKSFVFPRQQDLSVPATETEKGGSCLSLEDRQITFGDSEGV